MVLGFRIGGTGIRNRWGWDSEEVGLGLGRSGAGIRKRWKWITPST